MSVRWLRLLPVLQLRGLWSVDGRLLLAAGGGLLSGLWLVVGSRWWPARWPDSGLTDGLGTVPDSRRRVARRTEVRRVRLLLGLQPRRLWAAVSRRQATGGGRMDGLRLVTDSRRRVARRTVVRRVWLLLGLQP